VTAFVGKLRLLLGLRVTLLWRRAMQRGWLVRVGAALAAPVAVLFGLGLIGATATASAEMLPTHRAFAAMGVLAALHALVFVEVVSRVGRGEGMAAALYPYPLSPLLIHTAEALGGAATPTLATGAAVLLGLALGSGPVAAAWALLAVAWLVGVRQLAVLGIAALLRRRWVRDLALALLSLSGLLFWFGWIWLGDRVSVSGLVAWLDAAPATVWYLPPAWFVVAFDGVPRPPGAAVAGLLGAPLMVAAAWVVGADFQDRVLFGEAAPLVSGRSRRRRGPRWHLADRLPLALLPPAVWATAGKELKVLRRDPFLLVMLASQAVVLIVPPLLFGLGGPAGRFWLPAFVLLLLLAEQGPLFNTIATEGRALRFLAQQPTPRWQVLLGKNLAFYSLYAVFDAAVLGLACWMFDAPDRWALLFAATGCGLLVVGGVGNLVSATFPIPWMGARAAAGGTRAAAAAAEGGVEQPGCGTAIVRTLMGQVSLMLAAVPLVLLLFGHGLLGERVWVTALPASVAWGVGVWIVGTALAVGRLDRAEERILARLATRGAG